MVDYVSFYGNDDVVYLDGQGLPRSYETVSQARLGTNMWENRNLIINNSPICFAANVNTPVLLQANPEDHRVPSYQGIEFFKALRRLGKRSWLIRDPFGEHDFGISYPIQFFDHYLKDSACPRWMLYGIPAKDKGIIDGLDLIKEKDPKTGKWVTPKEGGLLTDEEKKRVETLRHRKPVTVTIE